MRVLVTRAEPAANRTASALIERGHSPILMPLTELTDTGHPLPSMPFDGFIFTSANAARILSARGWANENKATPAFCVGKRTAEAARKIGFEKLTTADGGGAKLAKKIKAGGNGTSQKLLYLTTPDRKFDMKIALEPFGISVENCEIYQMQPRDFQKTEFSEALHSVADGAMLVYSAHSAEALLMRAETYSMIDILQKTRIITISAEAAKPFEAIEHQNIYISDVPAEISMFHILDKFIP